MRQRITPKAESAQNDAFPGMRKKPPTTKAKSKMGTDSIGLDGTILGKDDANKTPHKTGAYLRNEREAEDFDQKDDVKLCKNAPEDSTSA